MKKKNQDVPVSKPVLCPPDSWCGVQMRIGGRWQLVGEPGSVTPFIGFAGDAANVVLRWQARGNEAYIVPVEIRVVPELTGISRAALRKAVTA